MSDAHAPSDFQSLLHHLLNACVQSGASDIHLAAGLPAYLRVHGVLEPMETLGVLPAETLAGLAEILGQPYDSAPLKRTGSLDGAMSAPDGTRYRFNIFRRQNAYAIALRRLEDA